MTGHLLVHVNASLNLLATFLLIAGFVFIKQRNEAAHKWSMLGALAASIAFLACYLYYHLALQLQTPFSGTGIARYVYFTILISHVLLAMTVPFLAVWTIILGLRAHGDWLPASQKTASVEEQAEFAQKHRSIHRWWAKLTFPIRMYVSVTGVLVYLMLYHLYPPEA